MKTTIVRMFTSLLAALPLVAAEPVTPAGHWEGAITLPKTTLPIVVDLARTDDGDWKGTFDSPAQGMKGFQLGDIKVDTRAVAFALPGIPGNPAFVGQLADDGQTIAGEFTQSGQRLPFTLTRTPAPAPAPATTEAKAPAAMPDIRLVGYWVGSLKPTPTVELRLALEITDVNPAPLKAVLISIDQGNVRLPVTVLTEKNGAVHFEVPRVAGSFDGTLNAEAKEIAGTWKQGPGALPIVFKHGEKTAPVVRSQEPKKPYPYTEEEVHIENSSAGVMLAGTLTIPNGPPPHPAVVLITGSGRQDRDEPVAGHRPFLVLADHLTRQGIAVLRCDDRGAGKSTGDFQNATQADLIADAAAAFAFLHRRPEVNSRRIGLLGHSEGGMIAPQLATKSAEVAFVVMLASPGVPMDELLVRQASDIARIMGATEEAIASSETTYREILAALRTNAEPAAAETAVRAVVAEKMATISEDMRPAFRATIENNLPMVLSPGFRDLLDRDPRQYLPGVKCPVLALNGAKDLQVAADENLAGIRAALKEGGNTRVKVVSLPDLNHLFQKCQTGSPHEYSQIDETFNPAALSLISDWIHDVTSI